MTAGDLRIGPAGWSYDDWNGVVYPDARPPGFDELRFIAEHFNAVELNNTFYRPPPAKMTEGWVRRTEGRDFVFTAKLWRKFTHDPGPWSDADVRAFKEGLQPLAESGRLGALLAQFAWDFADGPAARERLKRIAEAFRDVPLAVEVRHRSWLEALEYFTEIGVEFCNVDQPASSTSITGTRLLTGRVGYVRLHGRNRKAWFSKAAGRDEKYDYLYSREELATWVEAARELLAKAERVFVVTNNHFRGQAVVNALQLMLEMTGVKPAAPATLAKHYAGLV